MSDDLIKRLREIRWRADLMHEAADLIEQLERERDEAYNAAWRNGIAQEATEAKLAKAMEALKNIAHGGGYTDMQIARTVLAELGETK